MVGMEIAKIGSLIYTVRGRRVMLDSNLAVLYGIETGDLNKAVNRNRGRFPNDFMFQLTKAALENLRFQNGISSWGGRRYIPDRRSFIDRAQCGLNLLLARAHLPGDTVDQCLPAQSPTSEAPCLIHAFPLAHGLPDEISNERRFFWRRHYSYLAFLGAAAGIGALSGAEAAVVTGHIIRWPCPQWPIP